MSDLVSTAGHNEYLISVYFEGEQGLYRHRIKRRDGTPVGVGRKQPPYLTADEAHEAAKKIIDSGMEDWIMTRINYVELPAANIAAAKDFYSKIFGWALTDFGPTYACTLTGDVDIGLQGDGTQATASPLPVIAVDDLEAALAAVTKAGCKIVRPIFSFPGGRRFQFLDPNGNELAVLKAD